MNPRFENGFTKASCNLPSASTSSLLRVCSVSALSGPTLISSFKWQLFYATVCITISGYSSVGLEKLEREVVGVWGFMSSLEQSFMLCLQTWMLSGKCRKPTRSTNAVLIQQYDEKKCHTGLCCYTMNVSWWENNIHHKWMCLRVV